MKTLTNKEYADYQMYLRDKNKGRILTPDGLRLLCEGEQHNPEEIGKRMLETYMKLKSEGVYGGSYE